MRENPRGGLAWAFSSGVAVGADEVGKGRTSKQRFTFRVTIAAEPMPQYEWEAVQRLLARLIARQFAADHPELFRPTVAPDESRQSSGPPAAAAVLPEPEGTQR